MHSKFTDIFLANNAHKCLFVQIFTNPYYSDSFSFACVIIDVKPYVIVIFIYNPFILSDSSMYPCWQDVHLKNRSIKSCHLS